MTMFEQLVRGSSEIDRMRSEIQQVSNMLASMFAKAKPGVTFYGRVETGEYCWTSACGDKWADNAPESLSCWYKKSGQNELVYSTDAKRLKHNGVQSLPLEHVQGVHRSMSQLCEEMLHNFPELQRCVEPLLKAAQ